MKTWKASQCIVYSICAETGGFSSITRGIVPPGDTWLGPHLHSENVLRLKLPDVMKGTIEVDLLLIKT